MQKRHQNVNLDGKKSQTSVKKYRKVNLGDKKSQTSEKATKM